VASYKLLIKPSAVKELEAVTRKKDRQRLVSRIQALSHHPRPAGCEKLAGSAPPYRFRQGRHRIVYAIDDGGSIVEVIKIGHRRNVYR
jgi:mRNA interferase RelE/StbE